MAAFGLRTAKRSQFAALLKGAQPAPAAVLADVVSTSLFALVAAFPEAADLLPANPAHGTLAEQRAAVAWFRS